MRGWRTRLTAGLVSGALVAGLAGAPPASAAAVPIDANALANTLLGSYLHIVDGDRDYARHLVATAELTDWRARNPGADQNAIAAHLAGVQRAIEAVVPERVWEQQPHEIVAASLHALRTAPAAVTNGPKIVALSAKVVGRDAEVLTGRVADRIANAQPHLSWNSGFDAAQAEVWNGLGNTARADAAFRGAWNAAIGAPVGLNAALPAEQLYELPRFKLELDIKPLLDLRGNEHEFKLATTKKFGELTTKLYLDRKNGFERMKEAADQNAAGKPTEPTDAQKTAAEAEEKKRQGIINGAKGALDGLAWLIGLSDKESARQLRAFANGALQVATAVNKAITAFKLINSLFSMATVAFTGNVIGAISTLVSVFAGAGPSMEQLIFEEIGKLREQVANLHKAMLQNFERIDQRLTEIYEGLTRQLTEMAKGLEHMRGQLDAVSQVLVELSTKTQVIGTTVITGLNSLGQDDTWKAANLVVDYKRIRPTLDVTWDMYEKAENVFQEMGQRKAKEGSYVVPGANYGVDAETARTNLANHGHTGVVRYLSQYARSWFDDQFPVPAEVVNPKPWQLSANAYSLIVAQNPQHAKVIDSVRASAVVDAGISLRNAALRFSEPGPLGATNKLFTGLRDRYTKEIVNLYNHNATLDGVITKGRYNLWDGPKQDIGYRSDLKGEDTVPRCDSGLQDRIKRPEKVDGATLPRAQKFARAYYEPAPEYQVCWREPEWVNQRVHITPIDCDRPGEIGCERHWRHADLKVQFEQAIAFPGEGPRVSRRVTAMPKNNVRIEVCAGKNGVVDPNTCGHRVDARQTVLTEWDALLGAVNSTAAFEDPAASEDIAAERMKSFLEHKTREYFREVARDMQATASGRELNLAVDLMRAYTELGFPRAMENDNHLRALLYGKQAMPTGAVLAADYAQAAENFFQGKLTDQQEAGPGGCPVLPGLTTRDPYAICIAWSTKLRLDRLMARYAEQFKQRWEGTDQSLPEVQTTIRNLWLSMRTWHPNAKENPQLELGAPLAPPVARFGRPNPVDEAVHTGSAPALVSFKGRQYAAWRGNRPDGSGQDIYLSSTVDGRNWAPRTSVGFAGTQGAGPSLAEFNGQLVVSWRVTPSRLPNIAKLATSTDGQTWTQRNLPAAMDGGPAPALTALGGKLHALVQGRNDQGLYLSSSTDLTNWTTPKRVHPAHATSHKPALITFDGKLALAWRERDNGRLQFSTSPDGEIWSGVVWLWGGGSAESGPALSVVRGKLHAAWRNTGDRTIWGTESTDGGAFWLAQREVARGSVTGTEPALSEVDGRLLVLWQGADSPHLMSATSGVLPA